MRHLVSVGMRWDFAKSEGFHVWIDGGQHGERARDLINMFGLDESADLLAEPIYVCWCVHLTSIAIYQHDHP